MEQKQFTIVAAVIKNEKGEILLALRNQPDTPDEHNKWEFVGGSIDFAEKPEAAIVREVKEEAGLEVKVINLYPKVFTHVWKRPDKEIQIFILTYECVILGGKLGSTDAEISDLKFVDPKKIESYECLPQIHEFVKEFLW